MIDVMNTFIAIILSVVALTPIFLLVILLNKSNAPAVVSSTDSSTIKRLEDMDTTIASDTNVALETVSAKLEELEHRLADIEDKRTNVKGFKK